MQMSDVERVGGLVLELLHDTFVAGPV
eukprot:COSAG05_NODE_17116_length_331_cov_1.331897_1_plen_26_part_10